jgi:Ca2+/Na+ antiporter
MSYRRLFTRTPLQKGAMAYNRLLKTNLVLLVLVLICIGASSFALYAGNMKFIGILGIALLALVLVFWRIFRLTRNPPTVSDQKDLDVDLDLDFIQWIRPPQK